MDQIKLRNESICSPANNDHQSREADDYSGVCCAEQAVLVPHLAYQVRVFFSRGAAAVVRRIFLTRHDGKFNASCTLKYRNPSSLSPSSTPSRPDTVNMLPAEDSVDISDCQGPFCQDFDSFQLLCRNPNISIYAINTAICECDERALVGSIFRRFSKRGYYMRRPRGTRQGFALSAPKMASDIIALAHVQTYYNKLELGICDRGLRWIGIKNKTDQEKGMNHSNARTRKTATTKKQTVSIFIIKSWPVSF